MRYLILAAVAAVNLIFTGTVFPNLNIAGLAPDLIVCTMVSIVILEQSMTGALLGLFCGLILDMMFLGVIGPFSLPFFVTGAVLYFTVSKFQYIDNYLVPVCFAAGAYLIKELLTALIVYMLGISFSLPHMLVRYILPEALITSVFMLLVHAIFRRLYRTSSLKPRHSEDLKRLL